MIKYMLHVKTKQKTKQKKEKKGKKKFMLHVLQNKLIVFKRI